MFGLRCIHPVFGFPSSPELPLTGHNLGFLDQRFGLEWVQQNIAAFGGSPDKVRIAIHQRFSGF
jgi:carboxylesterase type B